VKRRHKINGDREVAPVHNDLEGCSICPAAPLDRKAIHPDPFLYPNKLWSLE
jgi:hypothetical protein